MIFPSLLCLVPQTLAGYKPGYLFKESPLVSQELLLMVAKNWIVSRSVLWGFRQAQLTDGLEKVIFLGASFSQVKL